MAEVGVDSTNKMFELATKLVTQSNRNIFLTGKAGTGKTTFLKYIRQHCAKQLVVLAPTGVAAINAGGVTIHSFFQLPLSPFIPAAGRMGFGEQQNNQHTLLKGLRYNSDKRKILQQLELLIIDEISMVRADILDAIDLVLRHTRHKYNEPFGGVQLLLIGDMLQLPPVIREDEWRLLSTYYQGPYFFQSLALSSQPPLYIEFDKIYRQNEEVYLNLLNKVRNNILDEESGKILEDRFRPGFNPSPDEGYIILTTHNNKAAEINYRNLAAIDSPAFAYEAEIKNDFPDRSHPAELSLTLKMGAQVMFIRNDSAEKGKRYYNGKIGHISRLEKDKVFVKCKDAKETELEIEVQKETWENVRYQLNKSTGNLDSETIGSFIQFPLRLAWAITIHKSQGLTFEKAIIDAGDAFAPGQVYVALSRCTTLSGLILKSRIRSNGIFTDPVIVEFSKQTHPEQLLWEELETSKKSYLQNLLLSGFDFALAQNEATEISIYLKENSGSFEEADLEWKNKLVDDLKALQQTAVKFQAEINLLFSATTDPDQQLIIERVKAAFAYFKTRIKPILDGLSKVKLVTDSWIHSKEMNDLLSALFETLSRKHHSIEGLSRSLEIDEYHKWKQDFVLPAFKANTYSATQDYHKSRAHPELHRKLKMLRDSICSEKELPVYLVASSKTIDEMVNYLPQDLNDLKNIRGFGEKRIEQFGKGFIDIISAYAEENELDSLMHEKKSSKETSTAPRKLKKETQAETVNLFKQGKTIIEIARQRKLTINTIESHLADYIKNGKLDVNDVLAPEKISSITEGLKDWDKISIKALKEKLGDNFTYGEIKMVISHLHSSH